MVLVLALLITSLPWLNATTFAQSRPESVEKGRAKSPFVAHRVLVRFRQNVSEARISRLVSAAGALQSSEISTTGIRVVELPVGADEELYMQAFRAQPDVQFAELDTILAPAEMVPDDPSYPSQWHLPNISTGSAWATTRGASSIVIAILDTGVDATHPDLASKITPGFNTYDRDTDTTDVTGHGTSVAGTAAAAGNNSLGVASVAWGCEIMPVRVSDPSGYAYVSTIAAGIIWAADHNARVANVSYACSDFDSIASAAQYFQGKGGVVTVAAGNDGVTDTTADNPYVLTASASTSADSVATWSNTGSNIDVAAPGLNIFTTLRGGGYGSVSGTSYSAPITAGVVALVMSANPTLNPEQVQTIVKHSADDLGTAGWDAGFGWGRLNAARAVATASNTTGSADVTPPTIGMLSPGSGTTLSEYAIVEASANDNIGVAFVTLSLDGTVGTTNTEAPYNWVWDTTTASYGVHTLSATAVDFHGNSSTVSISIIVDNRPGSAPPQISITSPRQSARISSVVSVMVNATDDVAVTRVELYSDGVLQASTQVAPFTIKWDTKKVTAGSHMISCKAYDGMGHSTMSAALNIIK